MFFDCKYPMFSVCNVFNIVSPARSVCETPEQNPYYALTYREKSDTDFWYCGKSVHASDGCISLITPDINFFRVSHSDEQLIVVHFHALGEVKKNIGIFLPKDTETFKNNFYELHKTFSQKQSGYAHKCNEIINRIFYDISCEEKSNTLLTQNGAANYAAAIIRDELSNSQFSIKSIAESIGISDTHLRALFTKKYKMNPKDYQLMMRMKKAKSILKCDFISVADTAKRCGYEDVKYFSTSFRKQFGISPIHYYEQTRENNER